MFPGKCILSFMFLFVLTPKILPAMFVADKGILPSIKNSIGFRLYVDIENESRESICKIHSQPKRCCLKGLNNEDCGVFKMYGETGEFIEPRDRNTLIFVLPVLRQHDLVGYCDLLVHSCCSDKEENINIRIPFDTSIEKTSNILLEDYDEKKRTKCETPDLDSFYYCLPVDCDEKYLGKRPFFDVNIQRCIETPICIDDDEKEMPNVIYDPNTNACKALKTPLTIQDIYAMSTGLGTIKKPTRLLDDIKVSVTSNCSTISQNLYFLRDLLYGKFCPCAKNISADFSACCKTAIFSIIMVILSICALILSVICCLNVIDWICDRISKRKLKERFDNIRKIFKKTENMKSNKSDVNSEIRNALLREVLVKDIPLELRDSIVSICDRMGDEVRKKSRYRKLDIGSQISLQEDIERKGSASSSSTTPLDVRKNSLAY